MAKLARTLGLAECVFFGVGSILGAGIYALIGKVAGVAENMMWLSFLLASATALCTAFSYAELSAMYPASGGEFVYAKKAFGQRLGNVFGYLISLNGIVTGSVVAIGFGGYLSGLIGMDIVPLALGIITLMSVVNIIGIRTSSWVNILFTTIELGGLVIVIYACRSTLGTVDYLAIPEQGNEGIILGSILAFFAFVGFEEIVKLAEETKNPSRTIPRALFIANIIVVIVYVLVSLSVLGAVSPQELAAMDNPLAGVVSISYGQEGLIILSVIALFATSNTILSNMIGSSRVLYDMSDEIRWMRPFSKVSPRWRTPLLAIVLVWFWMCLFVFIEELEFIALIATLVILLTFAVVNTSVIILRRKSPLSPRPFRIPLSVDGIPIISLLGIGLIIVLLVYDIQSIFGRLF